MITTADEVMEDSNTHNNIRKKLDMSEAPSADEGKEDDFSLSGEEGEGTTAPPPPPYVDPRERNKQRKISTTENKVATSAASFEEDHRA
jgi:hypothetical protein